MYPATALVGLRGLITLLERAAIRNAAKDARNVLGVIRVAEANEDLILIFRVEVSSHIKRVRVLIEVRAGTIGIAVPEFGAGIQVEELDCILVDPGCGKLVQIRTGCKGVKSQSPVRKHC